MKNLLLLLLFIAGLNPLSSQAPNYFKYQAVARDINGQVITGPIDVRLSFLKDGSDGSAVYVESHTVTSNPQGIFDLTIGKGTIVNGDLKDLQWSNHEYWIKIELKTPGNSSFVEMGRSQLLSVPYALYAADAAFNVEAGPGIDIFNKTISAHDESPDNELQTISLNGNELSLSHNGGKVILPDGGSENWSASGNTIYNSPNNYRVAIGATQATDARLSVVSDGVEYAGKFSSSGGAALVGTNTSTGQGVFGGSTDGIGGVFSSINGSGGFFSSANGWLKRLGASPSTSRCSCTRSWSRCTC